jgi:hypothetical protein
MHPSYCCKKTAWLRVITPFSAQQRLSKHIPMAMNTCNNRTIVGHTIFHAGHVLSKESLLLGTHLVKMCPQQQRIVVGIAFHAVHVKSKESSLSLISRYSSYILKIATI